MYTPLTQNEREEAAAIIKEITRDILLVLERHTVVPGRPDSPGARRMRRAIVGDVLGGLMMDEINCDGEDGRRYCLATLEELVRFARTHLGTVHAKEN